MRKYFTFCFINLLVINSLLFSQVTDVLTGLSTSDIEGRKLLFKGSVLYVAELYRGTSSIITDPNTGVAIGTIINHNGKILKIDISSASPSADEVLSGLRNLGNILIDGNDLLFSHHQNSVNKVSKIDVSMTTPVIKDLIADGKTPSDTALASTTGLAMKVDELYITSIGIGKIYKVDISQNNPVLSEFLSDVGNFYADIEIEGNNMYAIKGRENIIRINVADSSDKTGMTSLTGSLELLLHDGKLYTSTSSGEIIRVENPSSSNPTITTIVTGLNKPNGLAIKGDELYVAQARQNF